MEQPSNQPPPDPTIPGVSAPPSSRRSKKELEELYGNQTSTALHYVRICFIWLGAIIGIGAVLMRLVLLFLPSDCRWLSPDEIGDIDKFLFSGLVGAIVGKKIEQHFFHHN